MIKVYKMKKFLFIITLLLVTLLSSCNSSNRILAKKMIDKYSDDQNYITLFGEIIDIDNYILIIKCDQLKTYIGYEDEVCSYVIYSDEILNLSIGDQVYFKTVPFHFYNGHLLPIVEIKINENILLTFDVGKENLIEWVNTTFK